MGVRLENAKALYLRAIRDGAAAEAIGKYSGARYTQHSTPVKDGREGFVEFFTDFYRRNPVRDVQIVRGFEDGRYVFLHVVQILNDGEFRYVTADIFDTDDAGKMIEHWDMIAEMVEETASGHTQINGPTEPTDLHKTEENKQFVRQLFDNVLLGGGTEKVTDYLAVDTYIAHTALISAEFTGVRESAGTFVARCEAGAYESLHLLIGCGDFVATMTQANVSGTSSAVVDLFRVAQGRIVEHWDVLEEIAPRDTWVNSGKF